MIYENSLNHPEVQEVYPGIILCLYEQKFNLSSTFVRLSEFYESPLDSIRGKYFTLDEFMDQYALNNENFFDYFQKWNGFNVPSHIVWKFFATFAHELREYERILLKIITKIEHDRFYLISTYKNTNMSETIQHETAHGLFYLNEDYKKSSLELVDNLPKDIYNRNREWLLTIGYHEDVIPDEIQAYLSTTNDAKLFELYKLLPESSELHLPFRQNLAKFIER